MIVRLPHNKIDLALHRLAEGSGDCQPLLILHGLGEETGSTIPLPWDTWPGAVWGLDFTGHGHSTVPSGGGYTCEVLASDVDIALGHIGPATVVGRGLGAYVGLMTAAARPELVRGFVIGDGPGLAGGSSGPGSGTWFAPADADGSSPDPYALFELSTDVRPADYAMGFLRLVLDHSDLVNPVTVTAKVMPPWLEAVADEPGVLRESAESARDRYARGPKVNP
ncbi:MAG: alpha/beta hydrolase [Acidimicrobiales bacterium]